MIRNEFLLKIKNLFPKWLKDDMLIIREGREVFESL